MIKKRSQPPLFASFDSAPLAHREGRAILGQEASYGRILAHTCWNHCRSVVARLFRLPASATGDTQQPTHIGGQALGRNINRPCNPWARLVVPALRQLFGLVSLAVSWWLLCTAICGSAAAQEIIAYPREVIKSDLVLDWTFGARDAGWKATHDCTAAIRDGVLRIQSSGNDPYLFGPAIQIQGPLTARLRLKCASGGNGQIFWIAGESRGFDEEHSQHFHLIHDNQWHDYTVPLAEDGTIHRLRLDPGEAPGVVEVQSFQLVRDTYHPLEIQAVNSDGPNVHVRLKNYSAEGIRFTMGGRNLTVGAGATEEFTEVAPGNAPFRTGDLDIQSPGLPPIHRAVSILDIARSADWASLQSASFVLRAALDEI